MVKSIVSGIDTTDFEMDRDRIDGARDAGVLLNADMFNDVMDFFSFNLRVNEGMR